MLSTDQRILGPWFARLSEQLSCDDLFITHCRWHRVDKSSDVTGELLVAILYKIFGESLPAAYDLAPCFHKFAFSGVDSGVRFEQISGNRIGLCENICGIAPQTSAVDSVFFGRSTFAAYCSFGGIRLNAEQP